MPTDSNRVYPPASFTGAIDQVAIQAENPGQDAARTLYTGRTIVFDRGGGRWAGTVRLAEIGDETEAAEVEAFIASLGGLARWFELAIHRPTVGGTANVTATAAGGVVEVDDATTLTGLAAGKYLRLADRLHVITAYAGAGNAITIWPESPVTGTGLSLSVAAADTVRAGLADEPPLMRKSIDWSGPWTLRWEERY